MLSQYDFDFVVLKFHRKEPFSKKTNPTGEVALLQRHGLHRLRRHLRGIGGGQRLRLLHRALFAAHAHRHQLLHHQPGGRRAAHHHPLRPLHHRGGPEAVLAVRSVPVHGDQLRPVSVGVGQCVHPGRDQHRQVHGDHVAPEAEDKQEVRGDRDRARLVRRRADRAAHGDDEQPGAAEQHQLR